MTAGTHHLSISLKWVRPSFKHLQHRHPYHSSYEIRRKEKHQVSHLMSLDSYKYSISVYINANG